jgi:hypothetical protein
MYFSARFCNKIGISDVFPIRTCSMPGNLSVNIGKIQFDGRIMAYKSQKLPEKAGNLAKICL